MIINPVAIAKSFHIIFDATFISLFGTSQTARKLFKPISNYFDNIEINSFEMFYRQCIVWLKGISHLATL